MRIRDIVLTGMMLVMASCSMIKEEVDDPVGEEKVQVGDRLPEFSVVMNDGRVVSPEVLRGKPSLIVFFSTTCRDCQRELPGLDRRYREHGTDTTFVAISREQGDAEVAAYWTSNGFTLPYSPQADRSVYSLFATSGIPRIYISDATGIVRQVIK